MSLETGAPKPARCPICAAPLTLDPAKKDFRPFCSGRCADVDLNRWLSGGYAIAGADDESAGPEDDGA